MFHIARGEIAQPICRETDWSNKNCQRRQNWIVRLGTSVKPFALSQNAKVATISQLKWRNLHETAPRYIRPRRKETKRYLCPHSPGRIWRKVRTQGWGDDDSWHCQRQL